jgi:hypothetical protein
MCMFIGRSPNWCEVNVVAREKERGRAKERERESEREREVLLTIKKCLTVGKYNALSGNTDSGRTGSSI